MAFQRLSDTKVKGEGFDVFVENLTKLFERQLSIRNADDERNFQRAVLEENLPLEAQLEYRKEQLKRVGDDPSERKRVRSEMSILKDRIEQKKFADSYLDEIIKSESGITSVDSVLNWLRGRLDSETDSSLRDLIRQQIAVKEKERMTSVQNMLQNQTNFAVKDKSVSIISNQIQKVSSERSKALLAGNNELVSVFDLQIQSLERAKNESVIENDLKNFAVSTISGAASASALLNEYNNKILNSAVEGSVIVNGVTYASAREFWTFTRNSFLADNSNAGFFGRFSSEKDLAIKVKNSNQTLSVNDIRAVASEYDQLSGRSEFQPYLNNLQAYKQGSLQSSADFLSSSIVNRYTNTLDLNKAVVDLKSISSFGVNTDDAYTKILSLASATKRAEVAGILDAVASMPPGTPIAEAVAKAIATGAAPVLSPEQEATKTAGQIAQETLKASQAGTFGPETRTTVQPGVAPQNVPPVVPVQQPVPAPTPTPAVSLNKQLDFGITDPQVLELQKFLNKQGFALASPGQPGSAGFETSFFGPATQAALKKFQAAQGIVSTGDPVSTGFGRVGPQTLQKIQSLL